MKTSIVLREALFEATRQLAAERGTTVEVIVELALGQYLGSAAQTRHRLRRHSFGGRGLRPGLSESDWALIRERAFAGRGGRD